MRLRPLAPALLALGLALPLLAPGLPGLLLPLLGGGAPARAFSLSGTSLDLTRRDFRTFNNFSDLTANDNRTPDPDFPGHQGAVMAIWKASVEWSSALHGSGGGDPHQPGDLGSGGANFDVTMQGEALDVGTIDAYWQANIDLTDVVPSLDLYDHSWPLWTYSEVTPPAKFVHNEDGRRGSATSSLVAGGCIVSGSSLHRSLLFSGVRTHSFSSVTDSIIMPGCEIGRGARLHKCVVDSGILIPPGLIIGEDPTLDAQRFRRTDSGICLVTQPMIDRLEV